MKGRGGRPCPPAGRQSRLPLQKTMFSFIVVWLIHVNYETDSINSTREESETT